MIFMRTRGLLFFCWLYYTARSTIFSIFMYIILHSSVYYLLHLHVHYFTQLGLLSSPSSCILYYTARSTIFPIFMYIILHSSVYYLPHLHVYYITQLGLLSSPSSCTLYYTARSTIFSIFMYIIFNFPTPTKKVSSWSWPYGSWIYNYLCNQCLSPLTLWVRIPLRRGMLEITLCDKVCQ